MQVVGVVAALGLVTACTTSNSGGPSNQVIGTFTGRITLLGSSN